LGYEPNELPTAPPRDVFLKFSIAFLILNHHSPLFDPGPQNFLELMPNFRCGLLNGVQK
jgi:hypothetical protein